MSLSKTLNHCFVFRMGRTKAVGPMCCVTHVIEPSALIQKRRGSPLPGCGCAALVNPYKVLHNWVSELISSITYLSEILYILSALSTLFGRYAVRLRYYYNYYHYCRACRRTIESSVVTFIQRSMVRVPLQLTCLCSTLDH